MKEETFVTVPLVRVSLTEDKNDPRCNRVAYFVKDTLIMDLSIEKEYAPIGEHFPAMILTQLLVTPHEHLALLSEFLTVGSSIDKDALASVLPSEISVDRYQALLDRTKKLLTPPDPDLSTDSP